MRWSSKKMCAPKPDSTSFLLTLPRKNASSTLTFQARSVLMARSCAGALRLVTRAVRIGNSIFPQILSVLIVERQVKHSFGFFNHAVGYTSPVSNLLFDFRVSSIVLIINSPLTSYESSKRFPKLFSLQGPFRI